MTFVSKLTRRQFLKTALAAGSAAAVQWGTPAFPAVKAGGRKDCPVVVIGAGLGGLVAAAYLSGYGFPVTLIEQHSIPGGYATSFDRAGGRFTFDVSLHATVAENAMPQRILSDLGLWEKLEVVYTPELRRIKTRNFDVTLPARDPEGVKKALSDVFPHERKGIHGFYSEMIQVIEELWEQSTFDVSMMDRLSRMNLAQWMDDHVSDPAVKDCLSLFSSYYGTSPEKTNALFYAIATGEYLVMGGQYYRTRSQDLSDTLACAVLDNGGDIVYNTRVESIAFGSDNQVEGVLDSRGTSYPAKAVVANCSAPVLFDSMVPEGLVPESFRSNLDRLRPSVSSFVVWLGLNRELEGISSYEIDIRGDSSGSGFGVTIYDNLFKGYSRPGTSTLSLIRLADHAEWKPFEADYKKGEKSAYNLKKQQIAREMILDLEKELIPGLSKMIEVMEAATPLTNQRYTGNPGGAVYGFDSDSKTLDTRTPVKGLYLAGAWSSGGGYTPVMMSGRDAAMAVLADAAG